MSKFDWLWKGWYRAAQQNCPSSIALFTFRISKDWLKAFESWASKWEWHFFNFQSLILSLFFLLPKHRYHSSSQYFNYNHLASQVANSIGLLFLNIIDEIYFRLVLCFFTFSIVKIERRCWYLLVSSLFLFLFFFF